MDPHPATVGELACRGRDQGHHGIEYGRRGPGFVFPDQHVAPVNVFALDSRDADRRARSRDASLEVAAVVLDGPHSAHTTGRKDAHRLSPGQAPRPCGPRHNGSHTGNRECAIDRKAKQVIEWTRPETLRDSLIRSRNSEMPSPRVAETSTGEAKATGPSESHSLTSSATISAHSRSTVSTLVITGMPAGMPQLLDHRRGVPWSGA